MLNSHESILRYYQTQQATTIESLMFLAQALNQTPWHETQKTEH
ncbi:MAG: hypothetical protein RL674_39 [Pseudomonadota bacterium]|jgi:hypothetical protein